MSKKRGMMVLQGLGSLLKRLMEEFLVPELIVSKDLFFWIERDDFFEGNWVA